MQIFKTLFLLCAAATIALQPAALAADNEAQAKARKALQQLMEGAPPATTVTPPATVTPAQPAPPPAAATLQTTVRQSAEDSAAISAAREAVRVRIAELNSAQPAATPQPPVVVTTEQAPASPAAPGAAADSEAIQRAREALQQKMRELQSQPSQTIAFTESAIGFADAPPAQTESAQTEQAREAVRARQQALAQQEAFKALLERPQARELDGQPLREYKPLEAPPMPFSREKQDKLAELLRKYRADEITPEQYHAERALIIGNP